MKEFINRGLDSLQVGLEKTHQRSFRKKLLKDPTSTLLYGSSEGVTSQQVNVPDSHSATCSGGNSSDKHELDELIEITTRQQHKKPRDITGLGLLDNHLTEMTLPEPRIHYHCPDHSDGGRISFTQKTIEGQV